MKVKIFYSYNVVLALVAIVLIFVASLFSLGTLEDHKKTIETNALNYFFSRLLVSLVATVLLCFFIFIINYAYTTIFKVTIQKGRLIKITLVDLIILSVLSVVFILFGMYR